MMLATFGSTAGGVASADAAAMMVDSNTSDNVRPPESPLSPLADARPPLPADNALLSSQCAY